MPPPQAARSVPRLVPPQNIAVSVKLLAAVSGRRTLLPPAGYVRGLLDSQIRKEQVHAPVRLIRQTNLGARREVEERGLSPGDDEVPTVGHGVNEGIVGEREGAVEDRNLDQAAL